MKKLLFITILGFTVKLDGQTQGYLDINNVKALILNRNDMFWDVNGSGTAKYEVPKGSGNNCNFASSLWIGGYDNGNQLHMAGMTYRQNGVDFWPGPLDTNGTTNTTVSNSYNKIWKINYTDINALITAYNNGSLAANTFTPTSDILTWPANGNMGSGYSQLLAPFVDLNSDGIYDPMTGDYPKIKGDQMLFYVVNDKLGIHGETNGLPLGIEMQVSAYAYGCPSVLAAYPELDRTTFYNYKIINRSANQYNNMSASVWSDADLGYYLNDYIGCDSSSHIGYIFNSDASETTTLGTPITSYQILRGPLADPGDGIDNDKDGITDEFDEQVAFSHFMTYNNNIGSNPPPTTNPLTTNDYFNYMRSRWKNGAQLKGDSSGYIISNTVSPTCYAFSGNPQNNTGWSEFTRNNIPGDRRFIIDNSPFTLKPKAVLELDFSIITTFDSLPGGFKNISKMKSENTVIKNFFSLTNKPNCLYSVNGLSEHKINMTGITLWPNPSTEYINIKAAFDIVGSEIKMYNCLGQQVMTEKIVVKDQSFIVKQLLPGVYFLDIKGHDLHTTLKFIKN